MSMFKRITATLTSSIDQVVSEIENHDAVIQATVNDMQKKIVEAKIRLRNARNQAETIKQQVQEQNKQTDLWRKRAVECAERDEEKALQCMSRARDCLKSKEKLNQMLQQYITTVDKLDHDLRTSEQKLSEMKQKQILMRARQSTSQAVNAGSLDHLNVDDDLQASFDRWEMDISRAEMNIESMTNPDSIEEEFIHQEQRQALKESLNELLAEGERK